MPFRVPGFRYSSEPSAQRLSQIQLTNTAGTPLDLAFGYDPLGNVTSITDRHDGYASDGLDASATYTYDHRGRLKSWTRETTSVTRHFAYDPLGNLTGRALDSAGAPPNQLYEHATKRNAITSRTTGETYAYDADGNTIRREFGSQVQHLSYDSAGRLTCVGDTPGSCNVSAFGYDVDGNRLYEIASGTSRILVGDLLTWNTSNNEAVNHVLAFGRRIGERRQTGAALRAGWQPTTWPLPIDPGTLGLALALTAALALLRALVRMGVPQAVMRRPVAATLVTVIAASFLVPPPAIAKQQGGGGVQRRWFYADHLGTGTLVTNAGGTVIHRRVFEPFGKVIAQTASPPQTTDALYTGQRYQEATNLYDFRARWYDPETARFLSVDPIIQHPTDPQTHNAYGYVRNNPLNNVDPDGLGLFSSIKKFFKKGIDKIKKVVKKGIERIKKLLASEIVQIALLVISVITLAIGIGAVLLGASSGVTLTLTPALFVAGEGAAGAFNAAVPLAASSLASAGSQFQSADQSRGSGGEASQGQLAEGQTFDEAQQDAILLGRAALALRERLEGLSPDDFREEFPSVRNQSDENVEFLNTAFQLQLRNIAARNAAKATLGGFARGVGLPLEIPIKFALTRKPTGKVFFTTQHIRTDQGLLKAAEIGCSPTSGCSGRVVTQRVGP